MTARKKINTVAPSLAIAKDEASPPSLPVQEWLDIINSEGWLKLLRTSKLSAIKKHCPDLEKLLRSLYKSKEDRKVILASTMNAMWTLGHEVFLITRDGLQDVVNGDINIKSKKPKIKNDSKKYEFLMRTLCTNGSGLKIAEVLKVGNEGFSSKWKIVNPIFLKTMTIKEDQSVTFDRINNYESKRNNKGNDDRGHQENHEQSHQKGHQDGHRESHYASRAIGECDGRTSRGTENKTISEPANKRGSGYDEKRNRGCGSQENEVNPSIADESTLKNDSIINADPFLIGSALSYNLDVDNTDLDIQLQHVKSPLAPSEEYFSRNGSLKDPWVEIAASVVEYCSFLIASQGSIGSGEVLSPQRIRNLGFSTKVNTEKKIAFLEYYAEILAKKIIESRQDEIKFSVEEITDAIKRDVALYEERGDNEGFPRRGGPKRSCGHL